MRGTHHYPSRPIVASVVSLAAMVTAAACSLDTATPEAIDVVAPTSHAEASSVLAPSETDPGVGSTYPASTAVSSPGASSESSVESSATSTSLPGVPADEESILFLPRAGASLTVLGVPHDDVLNVRSGPGADQPIVTTLTPTEDRIQAAGRNRQLPDGSVWYEIEASGHTGWANSGYLTYLGPTTDSTSYVVQRAGGYPTAPSPEELGMLVADLFADEEYSTVQMSVAPSAGDLAEVTFDVIGLGDDSIGALRIHVFAASAEEPGGPYSLSSVEITDLCWRGGSPGGLCV